MSPSPFAAALAAADAVIDGIMAEAVQITPQVPGDFGSVPDPERPAFDVQALVTEIDPSSADAGQMLARVPYEEFELEILRTAIAGRRVRKGDAVILLDRSGSPTFTASRIDDTDLTRLRVTLARVKNGG